MTKEPTINDILYDTYNQNLESRRLRLAAQMAEIAQELDAIDTIKETAETVQPPITFSLESRNRTVNFDLYTYATVDKRPPTYSKVVTSDINLLYLGARTTLPEPLVSKDGILITPSTNESRRNEDSGFDLLIDSVHVGKDKIDAPEELLTRFSDAPNNTRPVVEDLLKKITQDNPFQGIANNIPEDSLKDALLRKAILDYCKEQDPNFLIQLIR